MKQTMNNIEELLKINNINEYEIEYRLDEPYLLQVRLYNEDQKTANHIANNIMKLNTNQIIHEVIMVYKPHHDIINSAYSGIPFTAIDLDLDLDHAIVPDEDMVIMD